MKNDIDSASQHAETSIGKLWHIAATGIKQGLIGAGTGLIGGLVIGGIATALMPKTKDLMSLFNITISKGLNKFGQSETFNTFIRCISHSGTRFSNAAGYFFSLLPGTLKTAIRHPDAQKCLSAHIDSAQQAAKYILPAAGAAAGAATGMIGGIITATVSDTYAMLTEQHPAGDHTARIAHERIARNASVADTLIKA